MRVGSLQTVLGEARRTLLRFPFVLVAGTVTAIAAVRLTGKPNPSQALVAMLVAASLGLPLLTALGITAERLGGRARAILPVLGVAILVAFGVAWPHWSEPIQVRRFAQFSLGFHLLASFLPYLRFGELNGFWQYNRVLFLRFLTAGLYSCVLYLGLALAIFAMHQLFKAPVSGRIYSTLWYAITFVFNTWVFLAGIPTDLAALDQRHDYPRGLKVFVQFILIPLVVLYLAILTAYLATVLVSSQWPSGWIVYMVSVVSVLGVLTLLLVHPVRDREENRWVATYSRWFYVALLPAIGMLLASIGKRVGQYGITEDRYFIVVLSLWLAFIAALFVANRRADIRWIPITLCALAFGTAFGPQGAYHVSLTSQVAHLRTILARQKMLAGGVVHRTSTPLGFDQRLELSSTLSYLFGTHGATAVRKVLGLALVPAAMDTAPKQREVHASDVMTALGTQFARRWDNPTTREFWFYPGKQETEVRAISGTDYHVRLEGTLPITFQAEADMWELRVAGRQHALSLTRSGAEALRFPTDSLVSIAVRGRAGIEPPPHLAAETASIRAILVPRQFNGSLESDTVKSMMLNGDLYLTMKRSP